MVTPDRERAENAERRCRELEQEVIRQTARKHRAEQALWHAVRALEAPHDQELRAQALREAAEVVA